MVLSANSINTVYRTTSTDESQLKKWSDSQREHIEFSDINIRNESVHVENCANVIAENKPVVPMFTKTYIFPAGSTFKVEAHPVQVNALGEIVLPSSYIPVPPGHELRQGSYNTTIVYPSQWWSYDAKAGVVNSERVVILNVYLFPVRYVAGNVFFAESFELQVSYEKPKQPLFTNDAYDLLIICPREWEEELNPFVEHKESHGIKTKLVCLECIYGGEYFTVQGRDDAEKVKYFIKHAIEEWGIEYVLLTGGRKPGIREEWFLPVRYVHVYWADENRYISDLYYADVYDASFAFSSWDTDENNVFSEWKRVGSLQDEMDLYPDIYVGRWACRNKAELKIMIEKTMNYENRIASKKIVLVGGDNFDPEGIEGEIVCDKTLTYLSDYEAEKIYASQIDVTPTAIKSALENGASFIHLHGHASPISWSTHKPDNFDEWEKGLEIWDLPVFFNEEHPIAVIGGCHTSMFNISLTNYPWGIPAPEGLGWWFTRKYKGGAIASLGYTAFPVATPGEDGDLDGDGINEADCIESGYGYMQLRFFYAYGIEGNNALGQCWSYASGKYTEHFKVPHQRWHLHTIQSFVLLGDPSLNIGGSIQ
jgi:hypothetical protein